MGSARPGVTLSPQLRSVNRTAGRHPIHYDDYTLFKSPVSDFRRAATATGLPTDVHYLDRGGRYELSLGRTR